MASALVRAIQKEKKNSRNKGRSPRVNAPRRKEKLLIFLKNLGGFAAWREIFLVYPARCRAFQKRSVKLNNDSKKWPL
jgi:hypothetical protein